MKSQTLSILLLTTTVLFFGNTNITCSKSTKVKGFDIKNDLLLAQYDCKTDVDDLHSVAAFYTLLSNPKFSNVRYHAVAGTYGNQKGLYVPPNDLFELAFGGNWTDAHKNVEMAIDRVKAIVKTTLKNNGDIWIAEAGQSDTPGYTEWKSKITNPKLKEIWQLAIDLSLKYNGKEGRYNNEAVSSGGLDFSDLVEVCWILGLRTIENTEQFFDLCGEFK